MRVKDDSKQEALFLATIRLANEIGFAASSVSKIAKEAGVSPATLYIYFKNKEDLIVSTYVAIKQDMSETVLDGIDESLPVRDILRQFWRTMFAYITAHRNEFRFTEQFANSPFKQLVNRQQVEDYFAPLIRVVRCGIDQKIIKDVPLDILGAFLFHPILTLVNPNLCSDFELSDENIEIAFQLSWDAIKL